MVLAPGRGQATVTAASPSATRTRTRPGMVASERRLSTISRGPIARITIGRYPWTMQFRAAPLVIVLALVACPVAPKEEKVEEGDGADDATSDGEPRPAAAPKPGAGDGDPGDGGGDAGQLSCEDELERAKSALAACLAK